MVSEVQLLSAFANNKSLSLLEIIAIEGPDKQTIMNTLGITRKQYHSRMSNFINCCLIEKRNGKYFITSFGQVLYEVLQVMGLGIKYYWQLKAIDSIKHELPQKERNKIIQALIDKQEIKELLLRKPNYAVEKQEDHRRQNGTRSN